MEIEFVRVDLDIFYQPKEMKWINHFMKLGDVFEKGKQLALYDCISFTTSKCDDLEKIVDVFKKRFEKETEGKLLFIGINSVAGVKLKESPVYFKEGIQTLSMVQKSKLGWLLFKDALERLGYKVETDKTMHVISVK